jgi:hypothetical protein
MLYGDDGFICKSDGRWPTQNVSGRQEPVPTVVFRSRGSGEANGAQETELQRLQKRSSRGGALAASLRGLEEDNPVFMRLSALPQNDFVDNSGLDTNLTKSELCVQEPLQPKILENCVFARQCCLTFTHY